MKLFFNNKTQRLKHIFIQNTHDYLSIVNRLNYDKDKCSMLGNVYDIDDLSIKKSNNEIFTLTNSDQIYCLKEIVEELSVYIMYVSIICLIIALIVFINKKYSFSDLYLPYKKTLIRFLSFFMFICIFVLIDFDAFWTLFHKIFFAGNDLWILDLRKDILIMIVPPEFFNHLVITILFTFLIIIILAYCLLNYIWRKNND